MKKFLPLVLIVCCVFGMWYLYGNVRRKETTATVKAGEYTDIITSDVLIIRNETPITVNSTGFFQNSVPSGNKVERGKAVGDFYVGEPDEDIIGSINAVNEKLSEARAATGNETLFLGDISAIDNKIEEYTSRISALAAEGNQLEINKIKREIDILVQRKDGIKEGTSGGKRSVIAALEAQLSELEAGLGNNIHKLYAETSGIFFDTADGLEEMLNMETVFSVSATAIEELISRESYEAKKDILPYPVAKISDNSGWLISFVTDTERAAQLEEIGKVKVKFPGGGGEEITCRYAGCTEETDGKTAVFIKGTREIEYLFTSRKVSAEIYVDDYEGLEIPASALIKYEGKDAVEVRDGKDIIVKPVEVLFKNDDIAIVKEDNKKENSLLLYEEVVTR